MLCTKVHCRASVVRFSRTSCSLTTHTVLFSLNQIIFPTNQGGYKEITVYYKQQLNLPITLMTDIKHPIYGISEPVLA